MDTLTEPKALTYPLCMKGKVRTREKCPNCGKHFQISEETDIMCPTCQTRPKTFYIFLYWDKKKFRINRDTDGQILDSYRRAHRLLEAMRRDIDNGIFKISQYEPKEIEEFRGHKLFEAWMKMKKAEDLSPLHLKKVQEYVDNFFSPCLKNTDCRKIDSNTIETFFLSLPDHLSIKTKKNIMTMLKNFCYYLLRREILARMPYFHVLSPPQPPIVWISKADQEKIIEHILAAHRPIFYFLMFHPIRISEATALKCKDFNLQNMSVHICRAFSGMALRPRKNKKSYYLPLYSHFDVSILKNKLPEAFVFCNSVGNPYLGNNLRRTWNRACVRAGIKIQLKNATRHSIASQALNDGVPLEVISKALGHSSLEITRQRYANMEIDRLRVVVNGKKIQEINSSSING